MRNITQSLGFLVTVIAANACTPVPESSSQTEFSDSADVRIVLNRRSRWVEDEAWAVPPVPTLSIGVLDGPEEYQLVDVVAAARGSDGRVVLVDGGSQTVRLYDSQGAFLETLGGPGSGPGEFTDPGPVLVFPGDSVVVWDRALLRLTRFDPDGNLAGIQTVDWSKLANLLTPEAMSTISIPGGKGFAPGLYPGAMEPLSDGGLLVRLVDKTGKAPPSGFYRPRSGALRVSGDLSAADTIAFFGDTEQVTVDAPWGRFSVSPPGAKRSWTTHQGNPPRICIGDQEGPEISCFDQNGARTSIRWVSEPAPLTGNEIAEWRESTVQLYDLKLSRTQILEMLDQVPVPERRPPYSQIILDRAGNLWAERGPTEGETPGALDFLVFDPEGVLLGVVALPGMQVLEIGPDYVMGICRDELEVEYLHLHDLRKQPGAER